MIPVLAAIALLHAQRHALTVNVADRKQNYLTDTQTGAVAQRACRLVLELTHRRNQPGHFVLAQFEGNAYGLHIGRSHLATQRDVKVKGQAGDRCAERDRWSQLKRQGPVG